MWAVEGANGVGRPLAQRLLEAGEDVVDVPAKLAARARLLDTGHGRKTDAHDAHSVAVAAVRAKDLRVLAIDPELEVLRMLVERREALTRRRVQTVARLQALLAELLPGQAKKDITTGQAKRMLASVSPRDLAGKTRRRIAAEELAELIAVEAKMKKATAELKTLVPEPGLAPDRHPRSRPGRRRPGPGRCRRRGPVRRPQPVRVLDRYRTPGRLLRRKNRHRLSRAGNRRVNHMIHIAAVSQLRTATDGQAYYRRKRAEGKKPLEALRCLKRRISDAIFRQLVTDAAAPRPRACGRGSGRAPRGVTSIQRDRLTPAHRHFGSATSRTRTNDATPDRSGTEDPPRSDRLTTEGCRKDAGSALQPRRPYRFGRNAMTLPAVAVAMVDIASAMAASRPSAACW